MKVRDLLEDWQRSAVERRQAKRKQERLRREAGASARKQRAAQPEATANGHLHVGDQVVLDGGSTAAEVLEIEGNEALVTFGSMKMRVDVDRLSKVGGPRRQQVTVQQVSSGSSDLAALRARKDIDLRGYRVDEALSEVERFLDDAIATGLREVDILHGKGTGALRQAIHDYLAASEFVTAFAEAPPDQGGAGITRVTLA